MPRSPSRSRSRSYSSSRSRSPVKARAQSPDGQTALSPFLIRIFVSKGKHSPLAEFDDGNLPLRDEFQVYGWKTSTPTSLIRLLLPSFPAPYRSPLARHSFRHIYVDASQRGLYKSKDLVSFTGRDLFASASTSSSMEVDGELPQRKKIDEKTLDEYDFITGDLLSVSLYVPEPKVQAGAGSGAGGGGPGVPLGRNVSGVAAGRQGSPNEIKSHGWGDRAAPPHAREEAGRGGWGRARGGAVPPQEFRGGRSGAFPDRDPAGGGNWRGGPNGLGIRGGAGRRRSPRAEDGQGRNGGDRRSRSPDTGSRRESWNRRI
ncbi:hypothetical protein IAR55_005304 [Kwoniella newhampshirensis]|uniref:Sin3-associated polypeptide Sap18 n=1 Tax=Kwoniella newhampshirensis TaxID=1651941 RepID=A0AAW0YI57_9TREE